MTVRPFPLLIGHRGAMGHAPENTASSFRRAVSLGADAVECDVHLSRDQELVVIHDATLDRTTTGTGPVREKTWAALARLRAGASAPIRARPEKLWRLKDLVAWARPQKSRAGAPLQLIVEIKKSPDSARALPARLVALLKKEKFADRCRVISFDHAAIRETRRLTPSQRVGLLYAERPRALARRMAWAKADAVFPRYTLLSRRFVDAAHRAGWTVGAWTVNEPADLKRMVAWGVDAVATNFPERLDILRP